MRALGLIGLVLALVIVGLRGATVLTAAARVEPAVDARADWYARRMPTQFGETSPG